MKLVMFCQSLDSDWNHGNAHFLRGVLASWLSRGGSIQVLEPADSWSRQNLERDHGRAASRAYREAYPQLRSQRYRSGFNPSDTVREADVVIVHEWTDPELVAAVGRAHATEPGKGRVLLFHDTHHRCVSAPHEMHRYDLAGYDGVLAFGQRIRDWYHRNHRLPAFTWHEAADHRLFAPPPGGRGPTFDGDLVWIGNWGDDERTAELHRFLIEPVAELGLKATVFGVRYPDEAIKALAKAGITYGGYLPNHRVPEVFARHRMTVHVPRRYYVESLPGIPTIRPFEAMSCSIPLISAPWSDCEKLFRDRDYVRVSTKAQMKTALRRVLEHSDEAEARAVRARQWIETHHTCGHRVDELLAVVEELRSSAAATMAKRAARAKRSAAGATRLGAAS